MKKLEPFWSHSFEICNFFDINQNNLPDDTSILLTESPKISKITREKIALYLIEIFNVSRFYIANQQVLSLYSVGKTTGLAVDSGYQVTNVFLFLKGTHFGMVLKE